MFVSNERDCYNAPHMLKERQKETGVQASEFEKYSVDALHEWLTENGIQAVLFDFDDTLLDTNTYINEHKARYVDYISDRLPEIPHENIRRELDAADYDVFSTHSVSKGRWDGAIRLMIEKFPGVDPAIFTDGAPHLHAMYVSAPQLIPGAKDTVMNFRRAIHKIGLVTHADYGWTMLKLKRTGLEGVFDHVEVVDQCRNKEAGDWVRAAEALGVSPDQVLVIGDSVKGDMEAAHRAGVVHLVSLPSPWEKYREGDLPEGAIPAANISSVISTLTHHA